MTVKERRLAIRDVEYQLASLKKWHAVLEAKRKEYMRLEPDATNRWVLSCIEHGLTRLADGEPEDVELRPLRSGRGRRRCMEEILELEERRELLVADLPTEAELMAAERDAHTRAATLKAATTAAVEARVKFAAALDQVLPLGRKLAAATADVKAARASLAEVVREFDLDIAVPSLPQPSGEETRRSFVFSRWLDQLSTTGEADDAALRELQGAR